MQKTGFNVAQKWPQEESSFKYALRKEKKKQELHFLLFFVKPNGKMTVKVVRWQMSHLIFNPAEGPASGLSQETLTG